MARSPISVNDSVKLATRHPKNCSQLLANNLYPLLECETWFTSEWRLKFCAYFLQNMVDQSIEIEIDQHVADRIKRIPLSRAIRLIENTAPCDGIKMLVAIISEGLRNEQKLGLEDQFNFYNLLFGKFFPELEYPPDKKAV